jgi:glycosyltransferase involved in cell wall biosynthesis
MAEELAAAGVRSDLRLWARGVDAELFNPAKRNLELRAAMGFAPDDVVVLFVGRVVLEKGIDVFAAAVRAAAARNPKIRALVVGDGPERAHFEEQLPEGTFRGFLQGEDLAQAYASADIFLNPSVTETFGQVTLEAMASGLPCVCAAAAGSKSLVADRITGVLVPLDASAEGYARALESLAADAPLRKRYAAAARMRALKYDWTAVLDGLIDNYRDAVERAAPEELRA